MDDKNKSLVTETRPQGLSEHTHGHDHEHSDINIRPIAISAISLLAVCGLACLVVWGFFEFSEARAEAHTKEFSPLMDTVMRAPAPRLQVDEHKDLMDVRAHEDSVLAGSAVLDAANQIRRIPIDSAIDIVARRGTGSHTAPVAIPAPSDSTNQGVPADTAAPSTMH